MQALILVEQKNQSSLHLFHGYRDGAMTESL